MVTATAGDWACPCPGAEQDTAHDLGVRTRHCPQGGMLALLTVQWSSPARSRCQVEAQLTLLLQQICLLISALVEWMISHPSSRLKEKRWVPGLSGTQHRIVDNKKKTQETHCGVAPQI